MEGDKEMAKPVTVGTLKGILAEFDDKALVVLSSDEEGNSFGLMHSFARDAWRTSGSAFGGDLTYGDTPEKGDVPCVILYPA